MKDKELLDSLVENFETITKAFEVMSKQSEDNAREIDKSFIKQQREIDENSFNLDQLAKLWRDHTDQLNDLQSLVKRCITNDELTRRKIDAVHTSVMMLEKIFQDYYRIKKEELAYEKENI